MADAPKTSAPGPAGYAWQTCLDVEGQAAGHYPDAPNPNLFHAFAEAPRRVLELGCSTGAFGAELKSRYPGASVVGIEAGRETAAIAAGRLDRVLCTRIEQLDPASAGFVPGEFDTLVAADVLEHLVNPWEVLVRLKPYLSAGAQVIASIPNVRNAILMAALAVNGRWQYRERGLLDITHLRFFTLEEVKRMLAETGYRYEYHLCNLTPALQDLYQANADKASMDLRLGRFTLAGVGRDELAELCSEQFLVRARPA